VKPGDVVVSTRYGIDRDRLCIEPGDSGIIIEDEFRDDWFIVRWNVLGPQGRGYVCNVCPEDVRAVSYEEVWRIS